ncbi:DUF417 family protein, partial [Citrobacter freundii]|uniref:DUF417 family protein n=1 Tax=Citrobacter freundii TaxID=546 RepID=UPI001F202855
NGGKNSLNRLIRCVCGKKIGPDPRNFNQRVSLGRNDLLIRTFLSRWLGLIGGVLAFATPIVTLSFLITTPEAWVMPLGDLHHGFPYLSGAGRLVLKDTLMLAGAVMIIADSSRSIIKQKY